jgi:hypothetical protein
MWDIIKKELGEQQKIPGNIELKVQDPATVHTPCFGLMVCV